MVQCDVVCWQHCESYSDSFHVHPSACATELELYLTDSEFNDETLDGHRQQPTTRIRGGPEAHADGVKASEAKPCDVRPLPASQMTLIAVNLPRITRLH